MIRSLSFGMASSLLYKKDCGETILIQMCPTWDEVVSRAKIIKIAENITDQRDRGPVNIVSPGTAFIHSGTDKQGQTRQHNRSLQSITLENTNPRYNTPGGRHQGDHSKNRHSLKSSVSQLTKH